MTQRNGTASERTRVGDTIARFHDGVLTTNEADVPRLLLTIDEAALALACSRRTVENFIAAGDLRPTRLGARAVRVAVKDLELFVNRARRQRPKRNGRHADRDTSGRFATTDAKGGGDD